MRDFQLEMRQRREAGLYRQRRTVHGPQQPALTVDGQPLLSFCSNDYLGLANHPDNGRVLAAALTDVGLGGASSHLICGHHHAHQQLEQKLAVFTERSSALLFSTGYMANLGVISALAGRGDTVFSDRLNHASIVDACRLSGARVRRYHHGDMAALERLLADTDGHKLVVSDGVFSMDGDVAPLAPLAQLCQQHDALLMIDDAHGFGVLGPQGRGSVAAAGLNQEQVPVLMGTLGKAAGTSGAFVAGPAWLTDYLIQKARTYIYTTAMPPALALASCNSVQLIEHGDRQRAHLAALTHHFRDKVSAMGYALMPSSTPIQPIIVGANKAALTLSAQLQKKGLLVTAIRPPTVPEGQARLRITLSAAHSFDDLERLLQALAQYRPRITRSAKHESEVWA